MPIFYGFQKLLLIYENKKRSRDPANVPFGGVYNKLVLAMIDLSNKFARYCPPFILCYELYACVQKTGSV